MEFGRKSTNPDTRNREGLNSGDEWPALSPLQKSTNPVSKGKDKMEVNLNKPISSWEITQVSRAKERLALEIKQHLFVSQKMVTADELQKLEESSCRLEQAMMKMVQFQSSEKQGNFSTMDETQTFEPEPEVGRGVTHASLYNHSWRPTGPSWVWISKASALQGVGYPASRYDVQKYGHRTHKVRRIGPPPPLSKSFAAAVRNEMENRESDQKWKRRQDDWMEEDDLLGGDLKHEQDLRQKLLRGPGNGGADRQFRGNYYQEREGYGNRLDERGYQNYGGRGFRRVDGYNQGGRGFGRGFQATREWDKNARGSSGDSSKGQMTQKGQSENKGPAGAGGGRLKEQLKEMNNSQIEGKSAEIKCFKCLQIGHHQSDCTNKPVCYTCKGEGHLAVDCNKSGLRKIKLFGFGIPDQGFYAMELPVSQDKQDQAVGLVSIKEGEATTDMINEDLKLVVSDKWDFKARKLDDSSFLVVFPDKGTLDTFSRFAFELPICKLKVKISKSTINPKVSSVLQSCWVKIGNIPGEAKEEMTVRELAALVGQPVLVDELSLMRDEPARVKILCRNPAAIKGGIEVFFGTEGREISFKVEEGFARNQGPKGRHSGSGGKDDKPDKKESRDSEGNLGRKKGSKFDRMGKLDREQESSHGDSQETTDDIPKYSEVLGQQAMPLAAYHPDTGLIPIHVTPEKRDGKGWSIWDPTINLMSSGGVMTQEDGSQHSQKGSNSADEKRVVNGTELDSSFNKVQEKPSGEKMISLEDGSSQDVIHMENGDVLMKNKELPPQDGGIIDQELCHKRKEQIPENMLVVHDIMGPYLLEKKRWPNLKLPESPCSKEISHPTIVDEGIFTKGNEHSIMLSEDELGELTQEIELPDSVSVQSVGGILDVEADQQWSTPVRGKKRKAKGGRKVTIATRTSSRIPKDGRTILEKAIQQAQQKNDISKGTSSSSNQFLVLNNLENDYIIDATSKLDLTIEDIDSQIETFRAEERVRAALAEANYREYLEKMNRKSAPQGEEEVQDYAMTVMDNSARGADVPYQKRDVNSEETAEGADNLSTSQKETEQPKRRGRPRKNPK